ncbi:MAG: M48 family metalloprotease [Gammaproteobacteria bacterium]|nr:M48 family metalloprotease [Gammaproteobacteria bacterium]
MKFFKVSLILLSLTISGSLLGGHGAELYNEFKDTGEFYDDERWQEYVDAIGQRLLKHSKDKDRTYHFFVLDVPTINAFATGDGYIYVHRGLLTYLSSEDQLAAVIGHEIGHIALRHHAKRRAASLLSGGAGFAAYILTGRGELWEAADALSQIWISGYGREDELEADRFGAELLALAGYNPMAVIETISVLKDQELFAREVRQQTPSYHGLFATHPKNDKRLHEVVSYALELLPEESVQPVGDFWEMIDGLHYGMPTTFGTRQNIYYDKTYRIVIEFPENWRVQRNQTQVVGHAPNGASQAEIKISRYTQQENLVPSEFVRDSLGVKDEDIASENDVVIDCCEYYLLEYKAPTPSNSGSFIAIYTRANVHYLISGTYGPRGSSDFIKSSIEKVVSGIRSLTSQDLTYEEILKVHIQEAEPGDTYASLVHPSSLHSVDYPEETLRLINGHHPYGEPRAGDKVKVIKIK